MTTAKVNGRKLSDLPQMMTPDDVAGLLDYEVGTIWSMKSRGEMPDSAFPHYPAWPRKVIFDWARSTGRPKQGRPKGARNVTTEGE